MTKVKKLEWVCGRALTPFGSYTVWSEDEDCWYVYRNGKPASDLGEHGAEDAAQQAAQNDFKNRVLSVIE